jgi:riboflavin kinase/FMN adenylyltransferase
VEILRGADSLPLAGDPRTVATIGFFDGVHLGHQRVIGRMLEVARERSLSSVAVTFDRHPLEVLSPGKAPQLLTTLERRAELIAGLGVETVLVLEFTEDFSRRPAEDFAEAVLASGVRANHVVVGENFRFGHKALGHIGVLAEVGEELGFSAEGVPLVILEGRRVSSTSVRDALSAGDLDWPRRALGRRYSIDGCVVRGAGRGADLGWPTANVETEDRLLLPGEGVYAGLARSRGREHVAAINIGRNPTFGGEPVHAEAHLLDFAGDLVGERIEVEFWDRLRDEVRFESAEELSLRIGEDVSRTRDLVRIEGS